MCLDNVNMGLDIPDVSAYLDVSTQWLDTSLSI